MLLNWVQTGLVWYYFNVIAIAVIIYKMLDLAKVRASNTVVNRAESTNKNSNIYINLAMFAGVFGLVYFITREHIGEMRAALVSLIEYLQEVFNG